MSKAIYNTKAWQRLRKAKLASVPLCEMCERMDRIVPANTVDHRVPISAGGDPFPSLDGLASYCTPCHAIKTATDNGFVKGCDINGNPLNRNSDWYDGGAKDHGGLSPADPPPHHNTDLVCKKTLDNKDSQYLRVYAINTALRGVKHELAFDKDVNCIPQQQELHRREQHRNAEPKARARQKSETLPNLRTPKRTKKKVEKSAPSFGGELWV